jgi:type IX secretion system PorP/SprF family membrane protein
MNRVLSLVLCCFSITFAYGQQDKQFTHYMYDRMSYNPATTGFKGFCGTLMYRNQWDRVQDAPNSTMFNAQGNLQKVTLGPGGLGVGVSFMNDAIGFMRNNTVTVNAAYHYPTTAGILSAGVGLGAINVGFNPTWIPPQVSADMDPAISSINQQIGATGFDANFGLYWYGNQKYYVGISTTHIAPADLSKVSFSVARHYYVMGGYTYDLGDPVGLGKGKLLLKPSALIKSDMATMVFDINLTADYWLNTSSYFWAGASYRYSDAIAVMAGYAFSPGANINRDLAKIGYSFDIMTNPLNTYGKGTHELFLNYCMFPPAPPVPRSSNPFILE